MCNINGIISIWFVDIASQPASQTVHPESRCLSVIKFFPQILKDFFLLGRGELFSAFIEHARCLLKLPPSDNTSHGTKLLSFSSDLAPFVIKRVVVVFMTQQVRVFLFVFFFSDANAAFLQVLSKVCCARYGPQCFIFSLSVWMLAKYYLHPRWCTDTVKTLACH